MAATYNTPGVYVEEIPKFPPSIAPVETAIPAFIGYTEIASKDGESLKDKPFRIESIAEYELYFGGPPPQDVELYLDANNQFVQAEAPDTSRFYLYDCLRMFYANGGGKCYIVSVGNYKEKVATSTLKDGIALLENEDEPTIILSPDTVADLANGPYSFQTAALEQCKKLMDRVTLCDLTKATDKNGFKDSVAEFRNSIGINYLSYGTAYGPWIKTNLPRTIFLRNISLLRHGTETTVNIRSLTSDSDLQSLIDDVVLAGNAVKTTKDARDTLSGTTPTGPFISLEEKLADLISDYNATGDADNSAAIEAALNPITDYIAEILGAVKAAYDAAPTTSEYIKIRDNIDQQIEDSNIVKAMNTLGAHHKHAKDCGTSKIKLFGTVADFDDMVAFLKLHATGTASAWITGITVESSVSDLYPDCGTNPSAKELSKAAITSILAAANEAISFFHFLENAQSSYEKTLNDTLIESFGTYKNLVTKAAEALNLLPVSGAIAGVYAATDRNRGVWKAPANVSLNNVIAPAVKITHEQQGEYNVDVNAGKSINIIRTFTGKGIIVWGARTLAGNDNEWRYISVRRFFNFVEESTKKATEQFVFEPNDANTWVRIQGMIENFLTYLWRQGALQGIKPEHAFYVAVGLGKTMTAIDILEGRMNIEIGMAAVRPAEFIILKFSHKMAES